MLRSLLLVAAGFSLTLAGCNNCEKLEEQLCNDLGPEDCKVWKENGKVGIPTSGRKLNNVCGNMRSDTVYPGILAGAKTAVQGFKKAKAAQGG